MRHYCRATTAGNEENQAKRKWSSAQVIEDILITILISQSW